MNKYKLIITAITAAIAISNQACDTKPAPTTESAKHCTILQKEVEELLPLLDKFDNSAQTLIENTENDTKFDEELIAFTTKLSELLLHTDTIYANHQKQCKSYYAHKNMPDEVVERVYRSFIQIHAHIILTMKKLTRDLTEKPQNELLKPIIENIDKTAQELEKQLREQNKVALLDFEQKTADKFDEIVNSILGEPPQTIPQENIENTDENNQNSLNPETQETQEDTSPDTPQTQDQKEKTP